MNKNNNRVFLFVCYMEKRFGEGFENSYWLCCYQGDRYLTAETNKV